MARRRQPVDTTPAGSPGAVLPPELAAGPCMETWSPNETTGLGRTAYLAWTRAVEEWAERTSWAHERRPANNACNLARTRRPWSRSWLLEQGRQDLVDYYEGHSDRRPAIPQPWQPMHG